MDRMKTFLKYAIFIIAFYIFSNLLIYLNLETAYQNIGRKDNKITNKYLRIDLYSERDTYLGSKYIDVSTMREEETRNIEIYFKVQDVDYYEMKFTDEKQEGELPEMLKDLTKEQVVWGTFLTFLIFW